ncbi:tetratricopeptide repeat protein [Flagellimonas sediminis]|uniref:Tetratricopeptide repeat protein n=1 Tax=Flagellimonas sediminis TaxID=2696468 RepID=A0A6I5KUW1_9FLAO|nr:tetratricopeptide repeat protein [Allomuricauda sediminis]NDV44666.1 tetratricopeptide repeat protein [Allomuricauda sediminis]
MNLSFEEQLQHANVLLQENDLEKSIEIYLEALQLARNDQERIHLYSVLGRLYQKMKNPKEALTAFEKALSFCNEEICNLVEKASLLNNLAAIYVDWDRAKAIENYKAASEIFSNQIEEGKVEFMPHLANTQLAMAEVYNRKNDYYFAKKHYKEALKYYERLAENIYQGLRASAHYQLGNIYTEEFYEFDAKMQYLKALALYESLVNAGEKSVRPHLAAVLNNLGVTFNAMGEPEKALEYYDKALAEYQILAKEAFDVFQPYVAATRNSMGIVHAELKQLEYAIDFISKAVEIYNDLADARPQEFTHYLATGLHNLGLFHFELKQMQKAAEYFHQALELRKRLSAAQPENFDPDYCATALNLVELYQAELEEKVDLEYRAKALALLKEVETRLGQDEDHRPVIKNMKGDYVFYTTYFNTVDEEQLDMNQAYGRIKNLNQEIDSTIDAMEKLVFQEEIWSLLSSKFQQYPHNERLQKELAIAYSNLGWLYLRTKQFDQAMEVLQNAPRLPNPLWSLKCNLAHAYLLKDEWEKAQTLYAELRNRVNDEGKSFQEIILNDLNVLASDGIHHPNFIQIKSLFS